MSAPECKEFHGMEIEKVFESLGLTQQNISDLIALPENIRLRLDPKAVNFDSFAGGSGTIWGIHVDARDARQATSDRNSYGPGNIGALMLWKERPYYLGGTAIHPRTVHLHCDPKIRVNETGLVRRSSGDTPNYTLKNS